MPSSQSQQLLPGRAARYRGKVRARVISLTLTPEGHAALALGTRARQLSRTDYIEDLLRHAATRTRAHDVAAPHV